LIAEKRSDLDTTMVWQAAARPKRGKEMKEEIRGWPRGETGKGKCSKRQLIDLLTIGGRHVGRSAR